MHGLNEEWERKKIPEFKSNRWLKFPTLTHVDNLCWLTFYDLRYN